MVRIEIITKPGMGSWRGTFNFGYRGDEMNARNAFATEDTPEQLKRFLFSSQGPIVKGKTSLAISAMGNMSYDAVTIVAETPSGPYNDQVRRPVDMLNTSVRLEHLLGAGQTLRAEYSRMNNRQQSLGVGDFDLPERAYDAESVTDMLRVFSTSLIGKKVFSETKVQLSRSETTQTADYAAPTVQVLEAFTAGGAGVGGTRGARQVMLAQNFDITLKTHALRAGIEVNGGWWDSTQQTNAYGTFTFSSLDDYDAGRAQTYTRRAGDPAVSYSQIDAGWYVQDDLRLRKNLSVSLGLRQEIQTNMDDSLNLAPRAAFTWSVGRGSVRAGWGLFYDWLDSGVYEQTVRVDGTHQVDVIVIDPPFPSVDLTPGTRLPPSIIRLGPDLTQPTIQQASIGYERQIAAIGQFRTDYLWTRGSEVLRSVNVNAPVDGVRPDPTAGNITQVESTGRRAADRVTVAMLLRMPQRALFGNVMYQWTSTRNVADSALSLPADSHDPDADWGPASSDVRHRLFFMLNTPLLFGLRAGLQANYSSALPYTITTGLDDNGDTVFNDRPAGVGRNSARGASQWTVNLRVNRSFGFGGVRGPEGGPVVVGGPGVAQQVAGPGGGAGGALPVVMLSGSNARYRLDLYVQASNLFNHTNLNAFVGNQLSPYFGQATSAGPARRIEIGASVSF
jgi:hypothetical protein